MVLAIKTLFIHSPDSFDTSKLSSLPDPLSNPNFTDDFMAYIPQDEWNHFMASLVSLILQLQLFVRRVMVLTICCINHVAIQLYRTWKNFGGKKLASLANRELFAKIFLASVHKYTKNVFSICTDYIAYLPNFSLPIANFYLYSLPNFSPTKIFPCILCYIARSQFCISIVYICGTHVQVIPLSLKFWEEHVSPLQARWCDLVKLCGQVLEERDARRVQHVAQQNNKYQVLLNNNQLQ